MDGTINDLAALVSVLSIVQSGVVVFLLVWLHRVRQAHRQMFVRYCTLLVLHRSLVLDNDKLMKAGDE